MHNLFIRNFYTICDFEFCFYLQKIESDSSALALQIENISAEMSELQTRLISALEQLSVCKNQQAVDEERISSLSNKCVQLQTR